MKGSQIVQGLKSWASALHPQLPLSRRESQRLLNALTSSFRRQLDEVHPPHGNPEVRQQLNQSNGGNGKAERKHGLHSSSATFADKHMASVLTSPLLAHGNKVRKPDTATVSAVLAKHPNKDPIELLEEYDEQGLATIAIAVTCLESFEKSVQALPESRRIPTLNETAAGKRTLLWIWKNKIYEQEQFEKSCLIDLVVSSSILEGHEETLWELLGQRVSMGDSDALYRGGHSLGTKSSPYRWKAAIIRAIIIAKTNHTSSGDAMLEAFFRALELEDAERIPLASAKAAVDRSFLRNPDRRAATHMKLYDRLIKAYRDHFSRLNDEYLSKFIASWYELLHPQHPTPLSALAVLKAVFHPSETSIRGHKLRTRLSSPKSDADAKSLFAFFVQTIKQLEDRGMLEETAWVTSLVKELYPQMAEGVDADVREARAADKGGQRKWRKVEQSADPPNDAPATQQRPYARTPMPSFAI